MKKSIKLTVAFLMLAIGAFAGTPTENPAASSASNGIIIRGLATKTGIMIYSAHYQTAVPLITISDQDSHILFKGGLSRSADKPNIYNFSQLETGDYFITVTVNQQQVKKQIHFYNDNGSIAHLVIK